jgi:Mg/Co/Ni transporter MgtE
MSLKEQVVQELNSLNETEIKQVAEYVAFLKFRTRIILTPTLDETKLAALYAEFAEEDRELAEEGMSDYAAGLIREDA